MKYTWLGLEIMKRIKRHMTSHNTLSTTKLVCIQTVQARFSLSGKQIWKHAKKMRVKEIFQEKCTFKMYDVAHDNDV